MCHRFGDVAHRRLKKKMLPAAPLGNTGERGQPRVGVRRRRRRSDGAIEELRDEDHGGGGAPRVGEGRSRARESERGKERRGVWLHGRTLVKAH